MTDDEIITALECCNNGLLKYPCSICPLNMVDDCEYILPKRALDIINRQKAEIEKLAARFNEYPVKTLIDNNNMMCSKSSEDYDKWFFNMSKDISYQSIKEFAERLKENYVFTDRWGKIIPISTIDDLVKEMTGGKGK